jgi:dihydroorotate dehydrogenase (fumarate)
MSVDLTTRYLGLELANPLVPSSSPLTGELGSLRRLEEAGAAAVVLPSLFEEQIEHDAIEMQQVMIRGAESFAEALGGYFPELDDYNTGPGEYLEKVAAAKEALSIPVIASLNGTTRGGWIKYARKIEEAGADALELNVYLIPTDPYADADAVERRYLDLMTAVKESVSIPVAVKIGPYFSSPAHMAQRLVDAGADGLVLFNRFYQPDIDLEELAVFSNLKLSDPVEVRLPLRWIAVLRGQVRTSLAVTTGVHRWQAAIKALLVGADVAMMASALLKNGPEHLGVVLDGMRRWLEEHEYESVEQMKGSMSQRSVADPAAYVRANYMKMLVSYSGYTV